MAFLLSEKTGRLKRYQATIKTLKRGMETLPQTVRAAAAKSLNSFDSSEDRRQFARQESVQSVSATIDRANPSRAENFRRASERELQQLETAVHEYERHKRHHGLMENEDRRQHSHQSNESQVGLSSSCSLTILAAGSAIFAVLVNMAIKLEASGLIVVNVLFFIFVLLPNLCAMARLRRNPLPFSDSYRVPMLGVSATLTMLLAKTLLIRGIMDHYFVLTTWTVFGVVIYVFYGSKHSLAGLKRQKISTVMPERHHRHHHHHHSTANGHGSDSVSDSNMIPQVLVVDATTGATPGRQEDFHDASVEFPTRSIESMAKDGQGRRNVDTVEEGIPGPSCDAVLS
jgi:hypothetical protein